MDGTSQVISGVVQNLFPHVTSAQREAGYFDYYKTFWKVADDTDGTLLDSYIYIDAPTAGDDWVMMFIMGQRDTVSAIPGYATGTDTERKYASAYLAENITAGASTFVINVENYSMASGDDVCFEDGDTIILTDKATADAVSGNEEVLTISTGGVVLDSSAGNKMTITVDETIANSYTADVSPTPTSPRVSSAIPASDIETSVTTPVVTSVSGTFDVSSSGSDIELDNIGTVDEDWTITFTDPTNYTLSGDSLGTIGAGTIGSDYSPNNSDFTKPYFTIESASWGGSWLAGDTVTFTTHPAAYGIGQKRVVPALSGSLANNKTSQVLSGESV